MGEATTNECIENYNDDEDTSDDEDFKESDDKLIEI